MNIDVVMPVHNEEKYLPYSLNSLKSIEKELNQLIFVLDTCTDNSEQKIRNAFSNAKIYTKNKHRWRFYAAESFQYGFDKAKGDVIWAIGADLVLDPNIPRIIREIFKDPNIGTVCFRYLNYDLYSLWLKLRGIYDNLYKTIIQRFRKEARHTGFYAFRKEMVEDIGGLADIVSEYDEFCLRAKKNGWKVEYIPYTNTLHLRPGLTARKQYIQGVARYYLPHYNLIKTLFHSFIHLKPHLLVGYIHAKRYGIVELGTLK